MPPDLAAGEIPSPNPVAGDSALRYTVRRGDTLAGLSARLLGGPDRWPTLLEQHNAISRLEAGLRTITDPDLILVGESLAAPPATDALGRAGWHYYVQRGDSLWGIATRMYGDGVLWPRIAEANLDTVPEPSSLTPGLRLFVPASIH